MNMLFSWLVIAFLFLILEMGSPGLFYFLSFAFGAGVSAIASMYFESLAVQSSFFLIGTVIALAILKCWVRSWRRNSKEPLTNIYALQGKRGVVLADIAPNVPGQVKVMGDTWSARAQSDEMILKGSTVEVVGYSGSFLIVKEIK